MKSQNFIQSESLSIAVQKAINARDEYNRAMGFTSSIYSMVENGSLHKIQPTGLEIGARVYGMLGMGFSESGTFYVYSLPDEKGMQLLVEDGGDHRFDTWNIFQNDRPISQQFGIGLYWDDEEPGSIKSMEELEQLWKECDDQKKKNQEEAEKKRNAQQAERDNLRKDWAGVLVDISTVTGWKERRKAEKGNLLALLRHFFPGVRFTASTASDYHPSISWNDGPSVEQVREVSQAFIISGCTRPDDYYEQFPTQFNKLFGGWSGWFEFYRNYSGEYIQELAAELVTITNKEGEHFSNFTPATSEAFTYEGHGFALCQAVENNADRLHLVLHDDFLNSEDGRHLRRFLDCYGGKRTAEEVAKRVAEFADLRKQTETPNEPKGRKAAKSEPVNNEAPAAGLELVEIAGGVAVTGDTRTTYRNRAAIKAHGAKWNKDAQQWQATDAESVAALREWFGITTEPVASATIEPKETETDCAQGLDLSGYDFAQIIYTFNLSDYMTEQTDNLREVWESQNLATIQRMGTHFDDLADSFEQFLTSAAEQIAMQEGDEWAAVHSLDEVREAIRAEVASNQPKDTDPDRVRFNVYAGYYELYLTTGELDAPRVYQATFDTIEDALFYMEYTDPEAQIFCEDTREYLPEELRDELDDEECMHCFRMWHNAAA